MTNIGKNTKHKKLYDVDEVKDRMRSVETGFANYVLKNFARLNKPLDFDTAYCLGLFTVYPYYQELASNETLLKMFGDPGISKIQSVAVLSSIYNKSLNEADGAEEQLAGITAAIFDYDIANASYGFVSPEKLGNIADNCGTGGDTISTFHISTASALLAASTVLTVAKHGSPGNTRKTGSSDYIESFGIRTDPVPEAIIQSLQKAHFAYIEALDTRYKIIHTQTHQLAQIAHMNDIIGPMTSPVDPQKLTIKLLGTNQAIPPKVVAEAYMMLNKKGVTNVRNGMAVRGYGNDASEKSRTLDEISTLRGGTDAVLFGSRGLEEIKINYRDFGFSRPSEIKEISPEGEGRNVRIDFTNKVINGKGNTGSTNILLANTAALIALRSGGVEELTDAVDIAKEAIASGKYKHLIRTVSDITNGR